MSNSIIELNNQNILKPTPTTYGTIITCPQCNILFKTRFAFLLHSPKCLISLNKRKFNIINSLDALDNLINNLEIEYVVTFNIYNQSEKTKLFYCNYKENNTYVCPMTLATKAYSNSKFYINHSYLLHSHSIDFNQMRLPKYEINKIKAMITDNMNKEKILSIVNKDFNSPKSPYIGIEFINNLISKAFNENISNNKFETFLTYYNLFKNKNLISEFFFKAPGEIVENLDYPETELLMCFSFKQQVEFIKKHDLNICWQIPRFQLIAKNIYYQFFYISRRRKMYTSFIYNHNIRGFPYSKFLSQ